MFTDKALEKHAGRFVWLAIDVENAKNEKFLEKFQWEAVPTFLVVDPASEKVVYQWVGTADVKQLQARFDEAEQAFRTGGAPAQQAGAAPEGADALKHAHELNAQAKYEEAAGLFRTALEKNAVPAAERPRAVEALVMALSMTGEREACATTAASEAGKMPDGGQRLNVVASGLDCAMSKASEPWAKTAIATLEPIGRELVKAPGLLDDDRSSLYGVLVGVRSVQDDKAGAKALAGEWLTWLLEGRGNVASADARAALDGHLVAAAAEAGEPARAIPALEQSERDLPNDYNPPARLARVLMDLGRHDDAVAAIDRALGKAYGPRKISLFDLKATILEKKGDVPAARRALEDGLAYIATLPKAQVRPGHAKRLQDHLAKLPA